MKFYLFLFFFLDIQACLFIKSQTILSQSHQPQLLLFFSSEDRLFLGWQKKPTLGWLMNGAWRRTEGLKAFYSSKEEYGKTLLRVWSILTFYWGSGAVWPRCSHRKQAQDSACGEPLLAECDGAMRCRRRGCGRVGAWGCFGVGHEAYIY